MIEKKPANKPKSASRSGIPYYIFGSAKAAATNPYTKKRLPAKLPVTSSTGCIFCDLRLAPNQSGMHSSKSGSVACTRLR